VRAAAPRRICHHRLFAVEHPEKACNRAGERKNGIEINGIVAVEWHVNKARHESFFSG